MKFRHQLAERREVNIPTIDGEVILRPVLLKGYCRGASGSKIVCLKG
jgi:hypothetical protein